MWSSVVTSYTQGLSSNLERNVSRKDACENIEGMSWISSSSSSSGTDEEDSLEEEIGEFSGLIRYDESL